MEFEFDPEKSAANRQEHGIDFEDAQVLWSDPDAVEIRPEPETSRGCSSSGGSATSTGRR
jgi:uncharacterized DUF497 family protein